LSAKCLLDTKEQARYLALDGFADSENDRLVKGTGISKNAIANKMICFGLENYGILE
jgi:hypothetical protein